MKNTLDGGEAILEAIRSLKVDYIISSPGSEWSPVWEALARQAVERERMARPISTAAMNCSPSASRSVIRR